MKQYSNAMREAVKKSKSFYKEGYVVVFNNFEEVEVLTRKELDYGYGRNYKFCVFAEAEFGACYEPLTLKWLAAIITENLS